MKQHFTVLTFLLLGMFGPLATVVSQEIDILESTVDGTVFKVDWVGTFNNKVTNQRPEPTTASGTVSVIGEMVPVEMKTKVLAEIGSSFGIRFRVSGSAELPNESSVELVKVVHFPNIYRDKKQNSTTRYSISRITPNLNAVSGTGYSFDSAEEVLPGQWTISLVFKGTVVLRVSFDVVEK